MNTPLTRRTSLKLFTAGTLASLAGGRPLVAASVPATVDPWGRTHDRVFLGGEFWANPMEDWCVREGGAECLNPGPGRSVHSLTHQITRAGSFTMTVTLTRLETLKSDGGAGFRIGLRSEIDEHRSNCFVQRGVQAGWQGGQLLLGPKSVAIAEGATRPRLRLALQGVIMGAECSLTLRALDADSGA